MNIIETLRFFRLKLKLTQREMMSEYTDPSTYSKIESGKRSLKVNELEEILNQTSISVDEFFSFTTFDKRQQDFREIFYYCGAHLENKSTKQKLLNYYFSLEANNKKTLRELSNYIGIKNFFNAHWEEVDSVTSEEITNIFEDLLNKSFYLQYDYIITANLARFFNAKQSDLLLARMFPIKYEEQRDFTTKKFAHNILINLISMRLYAKDYESAEKYIKLAKKQDKQNENYSFKLNLQYLTNLLNYIIEGEPVYMERVYDFIHLLENTGDTLQAEQVKKEVKMLIHERDSEKMLNNYAVGLLKES
ncbi:transcriptional regulator [Enterococcus plantarum]|uniref:XRE family transcriptional regulator n=1 Tax=Enterococcus plantarum TaxID=1077675 RepID=A0A2W4BM59_9ENTE|nr:helix-turn-helix transcriptional regulator [Enterococcus plantarum]MBO0422245.1 helix-turn-helix transcriptional regulator [Enterococcus plantarum]MBO0467945.1 helix-turn-helix transcriptional regulator [Enterococcus plantarum]OEG12545.1 transcriptional regulator [Enterococcus plantarum]PZL73709.1 XRE family transcriptional regulator [Enterococcus plantarum]